MKIIEYLDILKEKDMKILIDLSLPALGSLLQRSWRIDLDLLMNIAYILLEKCLLKMCVCQ